MSATPLSDWEKKRAKELKKTAGVSLSQAQLVIRKKAGIRINSENCACVHLNRVFCASDTRLLVEGDQHEFDDEFACLCDECCATEPELQELIP